MCLGRTGLTCYIGNGQTRKSFLFMLTFIFCFVTFSFFPPLSHILCNDVIFNDERNRLQPDVASASNSFGRDLKNTIESREIIIKKKRAKTDESESLVLGCPWKNGKVCVRQPSFDRSVYT